MTLNKEDQKYILESSAKALVSLIPVFGGPLGSILGDALADRKEERIKSAIISLESDIAAHKEQINHEFINKEDFLDIAEKTFKRVMDERGETKRVAYKNILLNGILLDKVDYYSVEQQISILDQLAEEHLHFLNFLAHPKKFQDSVLKPDTKHNSSTMRGYLYLVFRPWDYELTIDVINDLENRRLMQLISKNLRDMLMHVGHENFDNLLTQRGKKFLSYIMK